MTNRNRNFSTRRLAGALVLLLFIVTFRASAQTQAPVPLPTPFTPVVDYAKVIDQPTRQYLESLFYRLKQQGNIEYAVLTVDTTGELDMFDYSLAVARGWGIGSKEGEKAAFLLVVAINDRKYFTQISDHLEGDLPDGLAGQIQREKLVPAFRQANYSKGIRDTIDAYVAVLSAKRGFTIEGIDSRRAYTSPEGRPTQSSGLSLAGCCTIIIIIFIIVLILSSFRRGGGGGGCLQALLLGNLFGNINSGHRRGRWNDSGWGGGGFGGGGFGGGGGGGFGGGFGGGGSFGGGGAGGSW